jgi:hypothetical protein
MDRHRVQRVRSHARPRDRKRSDMMTREVSSAYSRIVLSASSDRKSVQRTGRRRGIGSAPMLHFATWGFDLQPSMREDLGTVPPLTQTETQAGGHARPFTSGGGLPVRQAGSARRQREWKVHPGAGWPGWAVRSAWEAARCQRGGATPTPAAPEYRDDAARRGPARRWPCSTIRPRYITATSTQT